MARIAPKSDISPNQIKAIGTIFGECSNYKSGLRILIWPLEVPFFLVPKRPLLAKVPIFGPKKKDKGSSIKKKCKMGHPNKQVKTVRMGLLTLEFF